MMKNIPLKKNIVILISGEGSNLQALINAQKAGKIRGKICGVFSNQLNAYGLKRAKQAKIPIQILEAKTQPDHIEFDLNLIQKIDSYQPDLIALAGYMRILTPTFVQHYKGKILNIHPSLLPKYPGLHTHQRVLANGDKEHGSSVHFVTEKLDGGPVILQSRISVFPDDSEKTLMERIKVQEHHIYPKVVDWFMQGRLEMRSGIAWLDGQPLTEKKDSTCVP